MTVQNIIDLARTLTHTTASQVTDEQALVYLNIAYHDLENSITTDINEDFFWDIFTTDTIANQNEYVLPVASATTNGVRKITSWEIKWTEDDINYSKITSDSTSNYSNGLDYLKENIDRQKAFYELKEWSLFIYPEPDTTITNWLKLEAIVALKDLTLSDTEADIFPNQSTIRQFHHVLAIWMKPYIYSSQREFQEKDNASQEYGIEKQKVLKYLEDRNNTPVEWYMPIWTNLMY